MNRREQCEQKHWRPLQPRLFCWLRQERRQKTKKSLSKKDDSLKLYCQKIDGSIRTSISCNGNPFTPDADWEEIKAEKVCFHHDDGRTRACHELSKLGSTKKRYVCFDQKKKPFFFSPSNEWKRLDYSDKVCGELHHSKVMRHSEMPPLDIYL